jgi:TetR/AcrR family transcriptional regulator, cholesterol catabolism regulator
VVETLRQREIEEAASSLFHERGYSGTSVRDIARALDIQGASLYAHVASKEAVLWSIVDRTAGRFEAAADAAMTGADASWVAGTPSALAPAETLDLLVRAHVGVVTEDIQRASVFVHEWRALAKERRATIARRRDAYEARFRSVIEEGVDSGAFQAVDPDATAAFILTALNGLVAWYRPTGRLDPTEIADIYSRLALGAVGAAIAADEIVATDTVVAADGVPG